jgi:hypothetical protein
MALDEAIERVFKAYDKERLHAAPTDVVAQNLGYKGANNGAALAALASLRYYGLLERPSDGMLAVTKELEAFKYSPSEDLKRAFLVGFLRRPTLFAELLDKYSSGLPSDANLKYDLIQRGFMPATANSVVAVFRRSTEFSGFFDDEENGTIANSGEVEVKDATEVLPEIPVASISPLSVGKIATPGGSPSLAKPSMPTTEESDHDRIPVRLTGGRRAWLLIPTPFFTADKQRLKSQIDLLLTEDD